MGLLPSNTSLPCSSLRHPKAEPAGGTLPFALAHTPQTLEQPCHFSCSVI